MSRDAIERFFSEDLPRVLVAQRDTFMSLTGILTLIVEGAGAWTLKFGGDPDGGDALTADLDFEADCIGIWTVEAFSCLLAGGKDLERCEPVAVEGDERLLARLGALMLPAKKGGVGARLAALAA
jgi:hypothetical protein